MKGFPIELRHENLWMGVAWLKAVFELAVDLDLQWIAAVGATGADGDGKVCMA